MPSLSRLDNALSLFQFEVDALLARIDAQQLTELLGGQEPLPQDLKVPIENAYRALGEITDLVWQLRYGDRPVPIDQVSRANLDFFHNRMGEVSELIRRAYHFEPDLPGFDEVASKVDQIERHGSVHSALAVALDRWYPDQDDEERMREHGVDIDRARSLVEERWFVPDQWIDNRARLIPILIDQPTYELSGHIRFLILQTHEAFAFGLWGAVTILARAVVEAAIYSNASRLGIELLYRDNRNRMVTRDLKDLIDDLGQLFPDLSDTLQEIRIAANYTVHPPTSQKDDKSLGHLNTIRRTQAERCVAKLPGLLAVIFGPVRT